MNQQQLSQDKLIEILQLLQQDMAGVKQEIVGIKQEIGGMKQEIGGIRHDIGGMKQGIGGIKGEVQKLNAGQQEIREDIKSFQGAMIEFSEGVNEEFLEIHKHFARIDTTLNTQMVTKDYLDIKLADLKGELIAVIRGEDNKLTSLIEILFKKGTLSPEETRFLLHQEPFAKST